MGRSRDFRLGAVHDTETAVTGGLDMEFGSWTNGLTNGVSNAYDNYWLANPYLNGIKSGNSLKMNLTTRCVACFDSLSARL